MLAGLAVVVILAAIVFAGSHPTMSSQTSTAPKAGGFVTSLCDTNNNSGATTTLVWQPTASASSTLACFSGQAESIDLNLYFVASSSSSALQFQVAFSNNNVDWYYDNGTNVSSNVLAQLGATPLMRTWTPGITGTSTKNITITPTASKYIRVEFKTTGANAAYYAQMILKNNTNN